MSQFLQCWIFPLKYELLLCCLFVVLWTILAVTPWGVVLEGCPRCGLGGIGVSGTSAFRQGCQSPGSTAPHWPKPWPRPLRWGLLRALVGRPRAESGHPCSSSFLCPRGTPELVWTLSCLFPHPPYLHSDPFSGASSHFESHFPTLTSE